MFCCPLQGSLTLLATGGTLTAGDGVIAAATSTLQNAANWQAFLLSRAAVCALPAGSKRALQDALTLWLASYFGCLFLLICAGRFAHGVTPFCVVETINSIREDGEEYLYYTRNSRHSSMGKNVSIRNPIEV
jgi:hypothetical protein